MKYTLDLTFYLCPLPLIMVKRALKTLPAGAELTLLLNEQCDPIDFHLLCEEFGYTFSHSEPLKITIQK